MLNSIEKCPASIIEKVQSPIFLMSPDLAAETGTHIGDGSLYVRRGGQHGSYRYDVTGHALEDQLYLFGTVIPAVFSAYGLDRPGFYINKALTWVSVRYQSKPVALFKHETLGFPTEGKQISQYL